MRARDEEGRTGREFRSKGDEGLSKGNFLRMCILLGQIYWGVGASVIPTSTPI